MPSTPKAVRYEHQEDRGIAFLSLYEATREPPRDPDARIVAPGGRLLAESQKGVCRWIYSAVGRDMLAREVMGDRCSEVA